MKREGSSKCQPSSFKTKNHKSADQHPQILKQKVEREIKLGMIIGQYKKPQLPTI